MDQGDIMGAIKLLTKCVQLDPQQSLVQGSSGSGKER